jgi:hypothetical protein
MRMATKMATAAEMVAPLLFSPAKTADAEMRGGGGGGGGGGGEDGDFGGIRARWSTSQETRIEQETRLRGTHGENFRPRAVTQPLLGTGGDFAAAAAEANLQSNAVLHAQLQMRDHMQAQVQAQALAQAQALSMQVQLQIRAAAQAQVAAQAQAQAAGAPIDRRGGAGREGGGDEETIKAGLGAHVGILTMSIAIAVTIRWG